jgi:hypothetical protein
MAVRNLVVLCLVGLLVQACASPYKRVVDDANRTSPGGRDVVVIVPQSEMRATVVASNIAASSGGGALFAIIDGIITQNRMSEAEERIRPIRDQLINYDFDQRAMEATKATVGRIGWLDVRNISFTKDGSKPRFLSLLDQAAAPQVFGFRYSYALSADFGQLIVALDVALFPKDPAPGKSPDSRGDPRDAYYRQVFWYVEPMPSATKNADANVLVWSADNGRRLREGIDHGLAKVGELLQRGLSLDAIAAENLDKGKNVTVAGQKGHLIETLPDGTLVYFAEAGRWTYVQGAAPES